MRPVEHVLMPTALRGPVRSTLSGAFWFALVLVGAAMNEWPQLRARPDVGTARGQATSAPVAGSGREVHERVVQYQRSA